MAAMFVALLSQTRVREGVWAQSTRLDLLFLLLIYYIYINTYIYIAASEMR